MAQSFWLPFEPIFHEPKCVAVGNIFQLHESQFVRFRNTSEGLLQSQGSEWISLELA